MMTVRASKSLSILFSAVAIAATPSSASIQSTARDPDQGTWIEITAGSLRYTDEHVLDVYRPQDDSTDLPVVVMIHGCCGDRADLGVMPAAVAKAGTVVFNTDWSGVKPGTDFREGYAEVACAVRYAREHAEDYGGDPRSVTLFGWSDGAMAAAVVAAGGATTLNDRGCHAPPDGGIPDALVGVAGFYGWTLPVSPIFASDRAVEFVGGSPSTSPGLWRRASPYGWLASSLPRCATLIVGETDPLRADALRYAAALRKTGHSVRLVIAPPTGDQTMLTLRTREGTITIRETIANAEHCDP
jgi:acetyl esterase/lipase